MSKPPEVVIALAGEFSQDLTDIGPGTKQRMDTAIALVESMDVPLITSGSHSFRQKPLSRPLACLMKDYAVNRGLPEESVLVQDRSLDTIGDALFTKLGVTGPRNWKKMAVVTSETHLARSCRIFSHVMGDGHTIEGVSAGITPAAGRFQGLQERVGNMLVNAILADTEPGDTDAIQSRLFKIVPGYAEATTFDLITGMMTGMFKASYAPSVATN